MEDSEKSGRRNGAQPTADDSPDVIADNNGPDDDTRLRPLQVRIPVAVFEAFSERAGREFGFSHGAKKQLFLKMWHGYQKSVFKKE